MQVVYSSYGAVVSKMIVNIMMTPIATKNTTINLNSIFFLLSAPGEKTPLPPGGTA